MTKNELFRKLPKVDKLLASQELKNFAEEMSYHNFLETIKSGIEYYRNLIMNNQILDFDEQDVIEKIRELASKNKLHSLRKVINGTGTIIHTNLGRSLLSEKMIKNMCEISANYNNLEYDLESGERGSRYSHLEKLVCQVTGAESAVVVNNNAAAVILCLNEFGKNKETIISRGELVEIGGSFRIPDIMSLSGTKLVEVGTTNRTHLVDYEKAVTEETALVLKVHASNYKMTGFISSISVDELSNFAKNKNIVSMEDIGSGVLVDLSKYNVTKEPTVQESIKAGIDIVTFSGDKLLGGAQAGIIVGKKDLINRLKKNQYLRAFRINKMTIAALEIIFNYYLDEREALREIPTLRMITESPEVAFEKADALKKLVLKHYESFNLVCNRISTVRTEAKIGGGAMPEETVGSYGLSFFGDANFLEEKFRKRDIPIIGRIFDGKFILDLKTINEKDFEIIAKSIFEVLTSKEI
ncbi:MAG: L-seryl-tRNA(Sec) selenium transferase [Fusobacteriaceae bacterium]